MHSRHAKRAALAGVLVVAPVDDAHDPADDLPVAPGQDHGGIAVGECAALPGIEARPFVGPQGRHPLGVVTVQPDGQIDEAP
jgi:hypothetical protein